MSVNQSQLPETIPVAVYRRVIGPISFVRDSSLRFGNKKLKLYVNYKVHASIEDYLIILPLLYIHFPIYTFAHTWFFSGSIKFDTTPV
ncbi:hypothetical protein VNO77_40305 [Canavalia gladiata]|uniref:Uncharacterized protein n=1 Tax=Canavalia gladiata TaxID=3824 RepID=A0AAN9K0J5_CANGL